MLMVLTDRTNSVAISLTLLPEAQRAELLPVYDGLLAAYAAEGELRAAGEARND